MGAYLAKKRRLGQAQKNDLPGNRDEPPKLKPGQDNKSPHHTIYRVKNDCYSTKGFRKPAGQSAFRHKNRKLVPEIQIFLLTFADAKIKFISVGPIAQSVRAHA